MFERHKFTSTDVSQTRMRQRRESRLNTGTWNKAEIFPPKNKIENYAMQLLCTVCKHTIFFFMCVVYFEVFLAELLKIHNTLHFLADSAVYNTFILIIIAILVICY